jgi:[ribosomal protein S5]-alanine N-acetyltransferase
MIFETERLLARPWTLDDAPYALQMYGDVEVMRYLGRNGAGAVIGSLDEMRDRLGKSIAKWGNSPEGYIYAALVSKESGEPVGTSLLKPLELSSGEMSPDEIEIGWHLRRDQWGKGLGTESGRGVMDYGFGLGLKELHAIAYPENEASLRIMRRIGMEYQGPTDRYYGVTAEHYLAKRG